MYGARSRPYPFNGYHIIPYQSYPYDQSNFRQDSILPRQGMNEIQYQPWEQYMNPFYPQMYTQAVGFNPNYYDPFSQQSAYQQGTNKSLSQSLFQNPLSMQEDSYNYNQHIMSNNSPFMNPYPKASFLVNQQPGMKSVLNSFKSQDGTLDINKMVDTAGLMINAVSQVSSVVKGLSGMLKV